jgi:synaptotagmin-like protein
MSTITASTTNSLPRLPTTSSNIQSSSSSSGAIQKAQSVYQFLQNNVKSARYRAPGFNRPLQAPKRAVSAPGLQPFITRRDRRNKVQSLTMGEWRLIFYFPPKTTNFFFISTYCVYNMPLT